MKKYALRDAMPDELNEKLKMHHPFVRELLVARGITEPEAADVFLNPNYDSHVHDPYLLKDMDKAVTRILAAIETGEKIAIYSDYDADGIPGAVVLHDFFKKIGYTNAIHYIPMRNEEGFGLNSEAIDNLTEQGATLLITIDCGIADVKEADHAAARGMDLIITDHHIPGAVLPKAFAIINPKQPGCEYPEKMLCGSGVIFKVVQALIASDKIDFPSGQEKWMLDMVGLATLSDMVPLLGENRVFARYGMTVLRKSPRAGLQKLFALLKISQQTVTEDDVAFMITPRINAASRMGIPMDAFKLLSTSDEMEADMLARHLNDKNDERKGVVAGMVKEIKKKIHERDEQMKHVLVLGNPLWKPSLLGLVANSFSDEHNRPVFFWGREGSDEGDSVIKGSCRSGGDTDVTALMERAKDAFLEYGGHKGAGGFTISQENIHTLEDRLNAAFLELTSVSRTVLDTIVDKKLSLDDVNWKTWDSVEKFAPFGFQNPKPLFLFEKITVSAMKLFGKEKNHLELKFKNSGGKDVTAIAFFSTPEKFGVPVGEGSMISLVATLEKSQFRNFPELRLRIVDIF
jgi:single-stranded-DNA-specific exonuclease